MMGALYSACKDAIWKMAQESDTDSIEFSHAALLKELRQTDENDCALPPTVNAALSNQLQKLLEVHEHARNLSQPLLERMVHASVLHPIGKHTRSTLIEFHLLAIHAKTNTDDVSRLGVIPKVLWSFLCQQVEAAKLFQHRIRYEYCCNILTAIYLRVMFCKGYICTRNECRH
jgi:hypothetical protein